MVLGIWKNKKSSQLEKERPIGASRRMRRVGGGLGTIRAGGPVTVVVGEWW